MAGKRRARRAWGKVQQKGKRFYAEYTGADGGRHTPGHSFATRTDASGWLAAERRLIDLDAWTPPAARREAAERDSITVGEWMDKYHDILAHRPKPPKKSTMQNYLRVTRNRVTAPLAPGTDDRDVAGFKDLRLVDVTKGDVYRWWDGIQRNYPDAPTFNRQAMLRVKAAFAEAVRREMLTVNPVDVPDATKKIEPGEKHLPEDWELDALLDHVPDRFRALSSLVLHHGLRIGEGLAVKREDLLMEVLPVPYLPRLSVRVVQNAQRIADDKDRPTYMLVTEPKTKAGRRTVPIMARDVPIFLDHLAKYAPTTPTTVETPTGPQDMVLLSVSARGKLMFDTSYRGVLNKARDAAGVTSRITPHSGRRWLVTKLAEAGCHLREIGSILGQEDLSTIMDAYMLVRAGRPEALMGKVSDSLGHR